MQQPCATTKDYSRAYTVLVRSYSLVVSNVCIDRSLVAREFDIPAVLGTGEASRRIRHGRSITVDGTQRLAITEPGNSVFRPPRDRYFCSTFVLWSVNGQNGTSERGKIGEWEAGCR